MHIRTLSFDPLPVLKTIAKMPEAAGLDAITVAAIPPWDDQAPDQNALCIALKAVRPGSVYAFGGLVYNLPGYENSGLDFRRQAETLLDLGCDGIKMIEGKPSMRKVTRLRINATVYDSFYRMLEKRKVPILLHVADPEEFWDAGYADRWKIPREWTYVDGTYPSKEELYGEMQNVLARFPELRVTLAHFGFLSADPEGASALLDRFPNLCLDLTPGVEMYANFSRQPDVWRRFFIRYQDRILFGTDNGYDCEAKDEERIPAAAEQVRTIRRFLETDDSFEAWERTGLKGLALNETVVAKIASGNFLRRIGGPPKPIIPGKAVAYCEWLYDRLYPDPLDAKTEDAVRMRLAGIIQLLRQTGRKVR
jgi:predicted TIM-barrel fold metal-dependent hydrolase